MDGFELEDLLKRLNILSWCAEGHDMRIHIGRPYHQSPDTVRVSIECIHCDELTVLEVKG